MASFLERLRQKPEATRVRYLFFSVGASFFLVAILWMFSLKTSLGSLIEDETMKTVKEGVRDITKDVPTSLDALIKAGKTLQGEGKALEDTKHREGIESLLPNTDNQPIPTAETPKEEAKPVEDVSPEIPKEALPPKENQDSPQSNP